MIWHVGHNGDGAGDGADDCVYEGWYSNICAYDDGSDDYDGADGAYDDADCGGSGGDDVDNRGGD